MAETTTTLPGTEVFKKATDASLNQMALMLDEGARLQAKLVAAGAESFEGSTELAKTSTKYVTELSAEWARLSIESTRKAMAMFSW